MQIRPQQVLGSAVYDGYSSSNNSFCRAEKTKWFNHNAAAESAWQLLSNTQEKCEK